MNENINKKLGVVGGRGVPAEKSMMMPSIGDYRSREEWEVACWQKILESKEILNMFITSYERHNLVMRVAVLSDLASGKSYLEIGRELFISPQTISGIKKTVGEKTYRSYLNRSKNERKKKEYSRDISVSKPKRRGWPRRTKYGTVYLPHY